MDYQKPNAEIIPFTDQTELQTYTPLSGYKENETPRIPIPRDD